MTEDEKRAVEWLNRAANNSQVALLECQAHARTLKSMLARPVLPETPTPDALKAISDEFVRNGQAFWNSTPALVYGALYAHLSHLSGPPDQMWIVTSHSGPIDTWMSEAVPLERAVAIARDRAVEGHTVTLRPA